MLHILLGDSAEDTESILDTARKGKSLIWIVPKMARANDRTLFHLAAHGLAPGATGSQPHAGDRRKGQYLATVREISLLPAFVPLAFIRENHQEWKWAAYTRSYTSSIDGAVETRLEELLNGYQGASADVLPNAEPLVEGAATSVLVTAYERNPLARQECIRHYGSTCYACGFSFGGSYGEMADGYIHVHHLRSVSKRHSEYVIDPVKDLRPICPNCHAVIHLRIPPLSIQDLKRTLKKQRKT